MILVYRFLKSLLVSFFFILATYGGIKNAVAQTKNIELNVSFRSKIPENFNINKFPEFNILQTFINGLACERP